MYLEKKRNVKKVDRINPNGLIHVKKRLHKKTDNRTVRGVKWLQLRYLKDNALGSLSSC